MILCEKKIKLEGDSYTVYLKRVPTKLNTNGDIESTTVQAFIKKD